MSASCPETGEVCGRACGSRWCVLKARRVVAEQAAAELRVRRVPAQREDVELALAIDERIGADLAERLAIEAKAMHVERAAGAGPDAAVARLAAAGPTSPLNAKVVPAARSEVLTPREAPGGPAAEWPALPPANAKGVDLAELTRTYSAVLGGQPPAGPPLTAETIEAAAALTVAAPYALTYPEPMSARDAELIRAAVRDGLGAVVAELDAVPDPLPLRAVPATDERPTARPLPPIPAPRPAIAGMRFTWTPEERHP